MSYKCAIFDLDGTIVDSGPGITKSVSYALERMGAPALDSATLRRFVGPPLEENFAGICGFKGDDIPRAVALYRELYTVSGFSDAVIYDGIPETLKRLKNAGLIVAAATNKPTEMLIKVSEHFGIRDDFDEAVGLCPETPTKAACIRYMLNRYPELAPDDFVMIGDRYSDAQGAKECGVDFIAAMYGFGERAEFAPYRVVFFADSPPEIADFILK